MKKAQITVFVIIVFVLLIGIAAFFAIRNLGVEEIKIEQGKREETFIKDKVNMEDSVETCLTILTLDGLEIMRSQAGYINVPTAQSIVVKDRFEGANVVDRNIKHVMYDLSAPGNEMPFWVTKDELYVPSIEKMESELAGFIDENILDCLNDFEEYEEQGLFVTIHDHNVSVSFDNAVIVDLNLPVDVFSNKVQFELENFKYYVPVNMRKIFDLSAAIAFGEYDEAFLEFFAADIISKYGYMGGEKGNDDLPPFRYTDVSTDCSSVSWSLDEVERKLKRNFFNNYRYVQLSNVDYTIPTGRMSSVFEGYVYTPFPGNFMDSEVDFFFDPELFMDLSIKPGGSTIKPDKTLSSSIPFMPMFCSYRYRFKYDLEYPIIVRVTDKDSAKIDAVNNIIEEDGGFTFSFPIWVYLCGNQKRECNEKDYSFDRRILGDLLVDDLNVDVDNIIDMEEPVFCDQNFRNSEEITITVVDSVTDQAIEGVEIGYYGGTDDCLIGATDEKGELTTRLPYCSGCLMHFTHHNYTQKYERFDVTGATLSTKKFKIDPQKEYSVKVKLVYLPIFARFWISKNIFLPVHQVAAALGLNEQAIEDAIGRPATQMRHSDLMKLVPSLGLTDVPEDVVVMISGQGPTDISYISNVEEPGYQKVKLGPGTYQLDYNVMGKVSISPSEFDDGQGGTETVSVNPTGFGTYNGDWNLGSYSGAYAFRKEDMAGKSTIVFYVPVDFMPTDLREVKDIDDAVMQSDESLEYRYSPDDEQPAIRILKQSYSPYLNPVFE